MMMMMMRDNLVYLVCAALHHPSDGSRLHLQETHQVLFLIMMRGWICYLQRHPLFKTWQECKIALKSQYFDLSNPGQCDGQVQVEGGRGSQSSCALGRVND